MVEAGSSTIDRKGAAERSAAEDASIFRSVHGGVPDVTYIYIYISLSTHHFHLYISMFLHGDLHGFCNKILSLYNSKLLHIFCRLKKIFMSNVNQSHYRIHQPIPGTSENEVGVFFEAVVAVSILKEWLVYLPLKLSIFAYFCQPGRKLGSRDVTKEGSCPDPRRNRFTHIEPTGQIMCPVVFRINCVTSLNRSGFFIKINNF